MNDFTPIPEIDRFIDTLGANITFLEEDIAFYHAAPDRITVVNKRSKLTPPRLGGSIA
jgi:hypothetical protein